MDTNIIIKDVALYLRKSRGEEDKDLEKHSMVLKDLAIKNNWRFIEYLEIGSSESIEYRPRFKQLLKDIEDDLFDAVLIVDYDRLGRGDLEDQGIIKRVFRDSNTLIITPDKIYNLTDDTDDLMADVQGLLARQEYKSIKKRLLRGKKIGARLGNWTNGTPSYPYLYNKDTKSLSVDEDKKQIYLNIKERFLNGDTCTTIAHFLNNNSIPSPRNGLWHENTIRRILIDETHIGRIISNKSEGSGHKNKKTKTLKYFPRDKWLIIENCHEAIKTQEEHDKIMSTLNKRKIIPVAARRGKYMLSGLVYCGKCGYSMQFLTKENGKVFVKKCQKYDPYGNRCDNRGLDVDILFDNLYIELESYEQKLLKHNPSKKIDKKLNEEINIKEKNIVKFTSLIERLKDLYEIGDYTREEYLQRKEKRQLELEKALEDLSVLETELNYNNNTTNKEKINNIRLFKDVLNSDADSNIKNKMIKLIVKKISYMRNDDNISNIRISFY